MVTFLRRIRSLRTKINNLDKGLYFPLVLLPSSLVVFLAYGFLSWYFFVVICSFAHVVVLKFYPYVKESNYYRYRFLKEQDFKQNAVLQPFFKDSHIMIAYLFILVPFYCSFYYGELVSFFFPVVLIGLTVILLSLSVEIVNISYRPRLPETISNYHPFFQRRYSPIVDVMIHKVVPLCAQVGKTLFWSYTGFSVGYKAINGPLEMDPARNYACNVYHQFPKAYKWTEGTLVLWSNLKKSEAYKALGHKLAVERFLANEKKTVQAAVDKVGDILLRGKID